MEGSDKEADYPSDQDPGRSEGSQSPHSSQSGSDDWEIADFEEVRTCFLLTRAVVEIGDSSVKPNVWRALDVKICLAVQEVPDTKKHPSWNYVVDGR